MTATRIRPRGSARRGRRARRPRRPRCRERRSQTMSQCSADSVLAAALRIRAAERQVDGAADLLVEERVAREALDRVVQPEGELAHAPRAVVQGEHLLEEVLPSRRRRLARPRRSSNRSSHVVDLAPAEDRREAEADRRRSTLVSTRAGEDLAVGEVLPAVAGDPRAAADAEGEVGALGRRRGAPPSRRATRPRAFDLVAERAPAARPGRRRRGSAAAVDEVLVLGERHLGVLGGRVGRVGGHAPSAARRQRTLEVRSPQRAGARAGASACRSGSIAGQRPRVRSATRSRSGRPRARRPRARRGLIQPSCSSLPSGAAAPRRPRASTRTSGWPPARSTAA